MPSNPRHLRVLIAVCLALVMLAGIACNGEMTEEKCLDEARELIDKVNELMMSDLPQEKVDDEMRKLDKEWVELDEKCQDLVP